MKILKYVCSYNVDILFPLTKAIPIMFGRVNTHVTCHMNVLKTLKTWIRPDTTHYHMRYSTFSPSFT